jgi:hypothetical protein
MRDLLVTKGSKRDCFVNQLFRRFITNCNTIFLSNEEACDWDCLVYHTFFILVKNDYFFSVIDVTCNLNQWQFF